MLKNYKKKLDEIVLNMNDVGSDLLKANKLILDSLDDCDIEKFKKAKEYTRSVASKVNNIDNHIVSILALHKPEAKDLRWLTSALKITNELMSISIKTKYFIEDFSAICEELNTKEIVKYAIPMQKATVKALKYAIEMISIDNIEDIQDNYTKVLVSKNKTDDIYEMIESNLKKDAKEIKKFTKYYKMIQALRNSEKIADRAMSIATLLTYAHSGGEIH
ncbi:MAG: PhoU family transcriptional regulator [Campylobacterota bacterium]|nr:PhoU family transcriptional regulator [Campylobacterota bacterium]